MNHRVANHVWRAVRGLACVALLAGCATDGETDSSTTSSASPTSTTVDAGTTTTVPGPVRISVTVGQDSGPDRVETVPLGTSVEVTLTNPTDTDNFHLHGYDIETGDIAAGTPAIISFTATQAGSFEIESHVSHEAYLVIEVK